MGTKHKYAHTTAIEGWYLRVFLARLYCVHKVLENVYTANYNLSYHMIWCPKHRRKVLVEPVEMRLEEVLLEKAEEPGCSLKQWK